MSSKSFQNASKLNGIVSVLQFGADPTGATDSTLQIQAAIDSIPNSGGAIKIPAGVYKITQPLLVSKYNFSIFGDGAGATRLINYTNGNDLISIGGPDIHSVEIAHLQLENASTNPSGGYLIAFSTFNVLDVKIHHITTFYAYYGIGTKTPETAASFVLDVTISDFEMRDTKFCGIKMVSTAGWKISKGTISFADPQNTQPANGSSCIYVGDWTDGFWMTDLNLLGGSACLYLNSVWIGDPRYPAQGTLKDVVADSGWNHAMFLLAAKNIFLSECRAMNLAGGSGYGVYFGSTKVDGFFWNGGQVCNNYTNGVEINNGTNIYFTGTEFVSNSRRTNATWHGAFVSANKTKFGFYGCKFYNDILWFGPNGQGYGLFIDSGCTNYTVANNYVIGNETGGIFDGSVGSNCSVIGNIGYGFGSATYDPPSLVDGSGVTTTVSTPGARIGDASVVAFSNNLQGITATAWVDVSDQVSVRLQNETGSTIDLASGTLRTWIERRR